jgi:hypothetical protein
MVDHNVTVPALGRTSMSDRDGELAPSTLPEVVSLMQSRRVAVSDSEPQLRAFLDTYLRTTQAVAAAVRRGDFEDPAWVESWDVAFARLYLTALDRQMTGGGGVSRPWHLAFSAPKELPPLRHVLLGINAHVNYDLPQALLEVISDEDFDDPRILARRRRDHERIDAVLSGRVSAEDQHLESASRVTALDRALRPVNRRASKRFLKEARLKVWQNTQELQRARVLGPRAYRTRLFELEVLSAARLADLLAPGQVLLRLAVSGFGVLLPPPGVDPA